jgi:hypothetical protein
MQSSARTLLPAGVVAALLAACEPSTGPGYYGPPWENPDSAYKVIENLEYAYDTMDLELYMSCFRDDFEFHLLEVSWPPESWGFDTEESAHQSMFGTVYDIDLAFEGGGESPWSGDSTGESWELERTFDLSVYMDEYTGFRASGQEVFICRPDGDGTWYVWEWFDLSDTKERTTWGDIKKAFL